MLLAENLGGGLMRIEGPAGQLIVRAEDVLTVFRDAEKVGVILRGAEAPAFYVAIADATLETVRAAEAAVAQVWRESMAATHRPGVKVIIDAVAAPLMAELGALIGAAVAERLAATAEAELMAEAEAEARAAEAAPSAPPAEALDVVFEVKGGDLLGALTALRVSRLWFEESWATPSTLRIITRRAQAQDVSDLLGWRGLEVREVPLT